MTQDGQLWYRISIGCTIYRSAEIYSPIGSLWELGNYLSSESNVPSSTTSSRSPSPYPLCCSCLWFGSWFLLYILWACSVCLVNKSPMPAKSVANRNSVAWFNSRTIPQPYDHGITAVTYITKYGRETPSVHFWVEFHDQQEQLRCRQSMDLWLAGPIIKNIY